MIGFGEFSKKRGPELIVSLKDARLVCINPQKPGFFDGILGYNTDDKYLKKFIEAVEEVREACLGAFWKPIYESTLFGEQVVFVRESVGVMEKSYEFWAQKVKNMPVIQQKSWTIGSEYQYYAFLVYLVNSLIKKEWTIEKALNAVVLDCEKLKDAFNDEPSDSEEERKIEVCGFYDIVRTPFKFLSCTNENAEGCWIAGGITRGYQSSIADLLYEESVDTSHYYTVPWLVLS